VDAGGCGVTKETADPAYWNDLAARYDAMAAPFTRHFAQEALAGLEIRSGTRLLDVATGTGAFALAAAERGAVVTAIDFAPAMVMRVAAHAHPRVTALQMDGQSLDLRDDAFDVVASVFGVMLFPDWRAGLAEMARVCRPGGCAIVVVWSDPEGAAIFQWLADIRRQLFPADPRPEPAPGMTALADPQGLAAAMVTAGFEAPIVRAEAHDFQLDLKLLDDPETAFSGMPLWTTLTTVQKRAVRAEIARGVVAAGVKNVFPITSTALIVTARLPG
jgi:SAM-dependent methyltransferase